MSMTETQKNALGIYAMVAAGAVLMLVPYSIIPFAGFASMFVGLIAAYVYRSRHRDNPFMVSHMRYVIRTVWWSSLILILGSIIFASIILSNGDLTMITNVTEQATRGIILTETDIRVMQQDFVHNNAQLIMVASIIGLLPYPAYLAWRTMCGVREAARGNAI